jgi:hypothetical protein
MKCKQDPRRSSAAVLLVRSWIVSQAIKMNSTYPHIDMRNVANNVSMIIKNRQRSNSFIVNDLQSGSQWFVPTGIISNAREFKDNLLDRINRM